MNFDFTEQQNQLRDSLASFLARHYDFEARRSSVRSEPGWRPQVWRALATELNLFGAAFPESLGGFGGNGVEHAVVMEEFGKALVVEPYLSTVVIGGGLLKYAGVALMETFVPRIIAGEVVIAFAQSEQQARYDLADVKTTASRTSGGYRLRGTKSVVIGAPWATHLIVVARSHGKQRDREGITALLVDKGSKGVRLHAYPTFDGGRAAEVELDNVFVPADRIIGEEGAALPLIERVVDDAICALCAEAIGVMRRMLADTVSYTSQRKQFGVPIGSFQALQHRMAEMLVQLEQSVAVTQVATMKLAGDPVERARAVSAAKVQIAHATKLIGQAAVQLHGGMGVTEELSLGHYFRRATAIGTQLGSSDHHLRRYSELAQTRTDMGLSPEDDLLRKQVRDFFARDYPQDLLEKIRRGQVLDKADHYASQRALQSRGWFAANWPAEYGGPGWDARQRYIFEEELDRAGAPNVIPMAVIYVGPVIYTFGTDEQKRRWLPDILESRAFWAQGYSEPESGSDLASLRTRAERDGDHYIVNGAKIWTSSAHWADWIFCLVRTSQEERKQAGITFLCMEMDAPGVTVTPIISIDGQHHLNRVTFDNVRVPVQNRIGDEGNGWHYAQFLLGNERLSYAHVSRKRVQLQHLRALAAQTPAGESTMAEDALFTYRLTARDAEVDVLEAVVLRALCAGAKASLATAATVKILSTELAQRITELYMELAGQNALPWIPERTSPAWTDAIPGIPPFAPLAAAEYFFERASTIYGGSTEVQKNILARELMRSAPS